MDIAAWLRELGLERYEPAFRENEIDAGVLPQLTESDLSALGLPIRPRRRLLTAIAALREGAEPSPAAEQPSAVPATAAEAERRQLTVMFCDLAGSTALSAIGAWRRRGRVLGFGAGIAQGYATLGQIGFADRSGYTAIGTVCNLAARLCAEAKDGQILVAQRVAVAVEERTPLEEVGELSLKGPTQPVVAYNVPLVGSQAAFRVIEGGAPSA